MPMPTGAAPASPNAGVFGLSFSRTVLSRITVHDAEGSSGHAPSWGDGASSLFRLFGTIPERFRSNVERSITRCPPEFVPE